MTVKDREMYEVNSLLVTLMYIHHRNIQIQLILKENNIQQRYY